MNISILVCHTSIHFCTGIVLVCRWPVTGTDVDVDVAAAQEAVAEGPRDFALISLKSTSQISQPWVPNKSAFMSLAPLLLVAIL